MQSECLIHLINYVNEMHFMANVVSHHNNINLM